MTWLAGLLTVAVLLGWARLALARQGRWWRLTVLAVGQALLAGLLFLTLSPPPVSGPGAATLTVATHGARASDGAIALPEATAFPAVERAPDLATALRRHPEASIIRIIGQGLEPRDRDAASGHAIRFNPPPLAPGIAFLAPPGPVAAGSDFRVGAAVSGGGTVELLDPVGTVVDRAAPGAAGHVMLTGSARVPGLALFALRGRGPNGQIETTPVPVRTLPTSHVRALFLAGSASPDVKQWRRWAADAGLTAQTRVTLGAGLVLGDPVASLTSDGLSRFDILVLDERSWAGLGAGERASVAAAVRNGLGVLLRMTAPIDVGTRASWRALGISVTGGSTTTTVRLTDDPGLDTTRLVATVADGVPMLHDAHGQALSAWHAVGLGRIGLWPLVDAAGLVTAGQGARYGALWSEAIAAVARPQHVSTPKIDATPSATARMTLCGLQPGARVRDPDGAITPLLIDAGCAAYWPHRAGWHVLLQAAAEWPFYVYAADALPTERAAERRHATLRLTTGMAANASTAPSRPGPSWPWFLGFLAVAALLWWFERARIGRA